MRARGRPLVLLLVLYACGEQAYDEVPSGQPRAQHARDRLVPEQVVREATETRPEDRPRVIEPAVAPDRAYTDTVPERVRRFVYRFTLRLYAGASGRDSALPLPGGELLIDVTADRLRATFLGPGWPVAPDSQVRMRRERHGAYVFDDDRGRPLEIGALAVWFSGGRVSEQVEFQMRRSVSGENQHITMMLCRFFAELSGLPVDRTARRCAENGLPSLFRLGPYLVDRTADVGVMVPRASMRADEQEPPPRIFAPRNRPMLSVEELARLVPRSSPPTRDPHGREPPERGLRIENRSDSRVLVNVDGTPIGYVDADTELVYEGLEPGHYTVDGLRPLGGRRLRRRVVTLPAHVRFGP